MGGAMAKAISKKKLTKLWDSMRQSRATLSGFRHERMGALRQFVGSHYGEHAARKTVPINLVELAVSTYLRLLAARAPQALAITEDRKLKGPANGLEKELNKWIKTIDLEATNRAVVFDALIGGLGIWKITPQATQSAMLNGIQLPLGRPYVNRIDLDYWVHDCGVRDFEDAYRGHLVRLPREWAMNSGLLDKGDVSQLDTLTNRAYDELGETRIETLSTGTTSHQYDYEDWVEFWELYLPRRRQVIYVANNDPTKILRTIQWRGPENGPFRLLFYSKVPDNIMPPGFVNNLLDLHDLINSMFRKLGEQATRQKSLTLFESGSEDDSRRIKSSSDGDMTRVDNLNKISAYKTGGADNESLLALQHFWSQFDTISGNLSMLAGLGPQSGTLGQDQLIEANASKRLADMQDTTVKQVTKVIEDMAHYLWIDPLTTYKHTLVPPGNTGITVETKLEPHRRQQPFSELDIQIEPYSMSHQTPSMRLQTMMQVLEKLVMPFMPGITARGGELDIKAVLDYAAKYSNTPEVKDLIKWREPDEQQQGQGEAVRQSPNTTKTYERVGRPGQTKRGAEAELTGALQRMVGPSQGSAPSPGGFNER